MLAFLYFALRDAFLDEDNMARVINGFLGADDKGTQADYALTR